MALTTAALAAVLWATLALVGPRFDLDIPFVDLGAACLMLFLLALAFGSIALAVGCASGHKGLAIGLTGPSPPPRSS